MGGNVEIPNWLKGLQKAPVFRPTDTEFTDPIAYISKIEKEASAFGICKIIPPLPKPSKKYVFNNLNKSLVKCPELGDALKTTNSENKIREEVQRAVFTTRQQELGTSVKKTKATVSKTSSNQQIGTHKQVWQSGKVYTLEQFEAKSKAFARSLLGGAVKDTSPLDIEAMFWKATDDKPIYVEYANDVPGSGFGEPDGHICRWRRRTRTRTYYRRQRDKDDEVDDKQATYACETKDDSPKKDIGASLETMHSSFSSVLLDETTPLYRKSSSSDNESEGTAGWKLSNSPWNLQVIARSAGSLTRFMPDDIPGVTSPMVYIGMLFSWFAWHVEDHELHSMNFLHVGAPKTWYAVPGDYAFDFEEVIRTDAYGGNIDRLAGLSRLGEKTTVLSPEVMVTSGIPCCRLVQNPGEFVVTFPRAYHIGFSHGFNCGEAANFATPQWLRYAREAAVRRAAMSYLPMLSHQQLLYLLTMSFMSRVPRSLLPGARSSRSRDRLREEKELLVKNAFLDDMVNENHLLHSLLLRKDSGYRAIVWNPSSLTSSISKESGSTPVSTSAKETVAINDCPKSLDNLLEGSYMEAQSDIDIEDDLFFDFQVDSGTLACVACGVLGFPFMCVMEPSSESVQILRMDSSPLQKKHEDLVDGTVSSEDLLQVASGISNRFLRPRIFCLEHGIQVQELLRHKGGSAKLIVICHSDYQKIKAYAATIAEETKTNFDYKDIPLEGASQEDLNLIEIAIADDAHSEDWTSRLGINLQHSVKVRRNSSTDHQFQHALTLSGLFTGSSGGSNVLKANWKARKSRSKTATRLDHPKSQEPCKNKRLESAQMLQQKKSVQNKIIQYTRRSKKLKSGTASDKQHEIQVVQVLGDVASSFVPAQESAAVLPDLTSLFTGSVEVQIINQTSSSGNNVEVLDGESSSFARSRSSSVIIRNEDGISTRTKENIQHIKDNCLNSEYSPTTQVSSDATEIQAAAISKVIGEEKLFCRSIDSQLQHHEIREEESINESSEGIHTAANGNKLSQEDPLLPQQLEEKAVIPPVIEKEDWDGVLKEAPVSHSAEEEEDYCSSKTSDTRACSSTFDEKIHPTTSSSSVCRSDQKLTPSLDSLPVTVVNSTVERPPDLPEEEINVGKKKRRNSDLEVIAEEGMLLSRSSSFVKSPCEGLRPRSSKVVLLMTPPEEEVEAGVMKAGAKKRKKQTWEDEHRCNLEGCQMTFKTKQQVLLHQCNRCHHEGCRKKFSSHKYAVLHQRVHDDDRPFKCPWKGCSMSFKWLWARTEHIRVHSGERPYKCKVEGCGLSFRFISDYSRHRRKTGHYVS